MVRFFIRFFLVSSFACLFFLACAPAHAAEQIGETCKILGVSTMASDQKNLIVCLKDDRGALVWKSMTGTKAASVPVGAIIAWPVATNPKDMQNADGTFNWLDCSGQSVSSKLYPELFNLIGGNTPKLNDGRYLVGKSPPWSYLEAGLPNIRGRLAYGSDLWTASGAFAKAGGNGEDGGGNKGQSAADFDASRSSAIYGKSNTVQPLSFTVRYLIRARS